MQEIQLGTGFDPSVRKTLEGMATHSSILAWIIPWTEEPGGQHSMVLQRGMSMQCQVNIFLVSSPPPPLFLDRANNFQSPLHLDVTITLSSGQWNVGGSDVCHFAEWPVRTSLHGLSPFPLWSGEWRKLHCLSPQSKLGQPPLKTADVRAEEVCWRPPCIHPTPITSPTSPQNTRVSCG